MGLFVSSIMIGATEVIFYFSDSVTTDICSATYSKASVPDELHVEDIYGRPAGRILVNTDRIGMITAWPLGTHSFTSAATLLSPDVVMPMPEVGVRGFVLEDGEVFSGPVKFVGEDGVYFHTDSLLLDGEVYEVLMVDVIGDPLFLRKGCGEEAALGEAALNDGPFLTTINGKAPDDLGNFMIYPGDGLVDDTVVRIEPKGNGLIINLVGSKVSV